MQTSHPARPFLSWLFVIVQTVALIVLVVSFGILTLQPLVWLFIIAGVALVFWAIRTMRRDRVTALPDPRPDAELIAAGPYRWIRHPMYTGLLLMGLGLLLNNPAPWRIALWFLLLVNQVAKALYEESLLRARFPDYAEYMTRTRRFIPYIF